MQERVPRNLSIAPSAVDPEIAGSLIGQAVVVHQNIPAAAWTLPQMVNWVVQSAASPLAHQTE